jgi:hypothetical protein
MAFLFSLSGQAWGQELNVFQHSENFWRCNLTLNNENTSSGKKYYFTFSYVGEDYQAFRSITLTIDGKEHWLLFANITQDWIGTASETCKTKHLDNDTVAALKNAKNIECKVASVRWDNYITFSLSSNIALIKQYIR